MLGLDYPTAVNTWFEALEYALKEYQKAEASNEEILGFHRDEFPEEVKKLENQIPSPIAALNDRQFSLVSSFALLKIIHVNNHLIEKQLHEAGLL